MKLAAHGKLNLALRVLGRQADGYHAIETLFLRLALADEIEIETESADPGIELDISGEHPVPADATNLCARAAASWYAAVGRPPACSIRLEKHIPVAAGLGGGSSDAAEVLRELNRRYDAPLSEAALLRVAGVIGSDVPFFLTGAALALGWERGRRLLPLPGPARRPVLLLVPDFGVSAGDAYAWWSTDEQEVGRRGAAAATLPDAAALTDWAILEGLAGNDLEEPVGRRHPELKAAVESLAASGAATSLLCGSGACVAGIYRSVSDHSVALERLREDPHMQDGWRFIETWTVGPGPASAG